jgi:ribosomal protein S18 acetylase RimI-like enzyme
VSIRPFRLPNDLELMNRLVADGFQYPENPAWSVQQDEVQAMIDRLDSARRLWPLLALLRRFVPLLRDVLCGYIDEQDGRPAGLINYMRPSDTRDWYIANVTVLPAFRRRGIARRLVEATLDELRHRHARVAVLDVVTGNDPAYSLYQELGFETFADSVEYQFAEGSLVDACELPAGYQLLALSRFDWRTAFELARRVTPQRVTLYEPVIEARFRTPRLMLLVGRLFERLAGSRSGQFAVRAADRSAVAVGQYTYRTRPGGKNTVRLSIDPTHPQLAEFVLRHVLASMRRVSAGHRVELTFDDWQSALVEAAQALGCERRYGMHRMGLAF